MNWQLLSTTPDSTGESPFWHPHENRLYWVDIPACTVHRMDLEGGGQESWRVPGEPGCIAPVQGGGLVLALRDGIYLGRTWQGPLTLLQPAGHDTATTRFNDGKCDVLGRFWAGSMYEPRTAALGCLYSLDSTAPPPDGWLCQATGAVVANGLAWSPAADTLYWADTTAHCVRRWRWDSAANRLSDEQVFARFDPKPEGWSAAQPDADRYGGRPDGAAVDVEGNYLVAMYEGSQIVKLSPAGEVLARWPVPVMCPTMPCFGGADGRTLFVTSARHGRNAAELAARPWSGHVLCTRVDVPGLPVNFFWAD